MDLIPLNESWKELLTADPIPWLLEMDNPSVRYYTMINLLDIPKTEKTVIETKKKIMTTGVIPKILEKQSPNGNWIVPRAIRKYGETYLVEMGYIPTHRGTIWQLIIFAEYGVDNSDPRIRKACDFVINHAYTETNSDGYFSLDHAFQSTHSFSPCFNGNMVYSLSKLGYENDIRVKKARDWLIKYQRYDDGDWDTPEFDPYKGKNDRCFGNHSCYMGCIKSLKAITTVPLKERTQEMKKFIEKGTEFFLIHHLYKSSHNLSNIIKQGFDRMSFPVMYNTDFLEILLVLTELGIHDKRMQDALELLQSKQNQNGRWILERIPSNMHTKIEDRGKESKWVTFRALKVLKNYLLLNK